MDTGLVEEQLAKKTLGEGCVPNLSLKERLTYFMICVIAGNHHGLDPTFPPSPSPCHLTTPT